MMFLFHWLPRLVCLSLALTSAHALGPGQGHLRYGIVTVVVVDMSRMSEMSPAIQAEKSVDKL